MFVDSPVVHGSLMLSGSVDNCLCRWLGVEKIYLMENFETPTPHFVQQIQDFVDSGLVLHKFHGQKGYQTRWYHECMREHHSEHNWLAFLDVDEYIVLQDECEPASFAPAEIWNVAVKHIMHHI